MTDPNDIVERLRNPKLGGVGGRLVWEAATEIVRLRELVETLTPPQWADANPSRAVDFEAIGRRFNELAAGSPAQFWTAEQMADMNGVYAQLCDEAAAYSRANAAAAADWCSPPPSDLEQAADAADEAHARLTAAADSHEALQAVWGVTYADMIRNGRVER